MVPEDYCSLKVKDLMNFIGNHKDSDWIIFKSRNGFVFEGYGIQSEEDSLVLCFNSVPTYSMSKGVFEKYSVYSNSFDFDYPFLSWMIGEAVERLKSSNDFVELYSVDDELLGRIGFFDGFMVNDNLLFILIFVLPMFVRNVFIRLI